MKYTDGKPGKGWSVFQEKIIANWEKSEEKWRAYEHTSAYRYTARVKWAMGEQATEEEKAKLREAVRVVGEEGDWFEISAMTGIPFFAAKAVWGWVCGQGVGADKSPMARFEALMEKCLEELEKRVSTVLKREKLDQVELREIVKTCRENMSALSQIGPGGEDVVEIVTAMPMDELDEEGEVQ